MSYLTADEVRAELARHLEWNPLPVIPKNGCSKSNGTRAPGFWDMHLHDDLILKKVEYLPSLVETLASLVDEAFSNLTDNGLLAIHSLYQSQAPGSVFPSMGTIEGYDHTNILDEDGVAEYYKNTTARICTPLASTLGLRGLAKWSAALQWTRDVHLIEDDVDSGSTEPATKRKKAPHKALADGFLRFYKSQLDLKCLPDQTQKALEAVDRYLVDLATFEFKNVFAGSRDVMEAIASLAGKPFSWSRCLRKADKCPNHLQPNATETVTTVPKGPDATDSETQWRLSESTPDGREEIPDISHGLCATCRTNQDKLQELGRVSKPKSNQKKAKHIIQQIWAEAVRDDLTFFTVQSGNYEFIALRLRTTQTLYLSSLINVSKCPDSLCVVGTRDIVSPSYVKLHTGLYIAALQDAENRASQIYAMEIRGMSWPSSFTPSTPNLPLMPLTTDEFTFVREQGAASMFISAGNQVLGLPILFHRCDVESPSSIVAQIVVHFDRERCPGHQVYDAHITRGSSKQHLIPHIIVKLAYTKNHGWERLEEEYAMYMTLTERGVKGIASVLGLYEASDSGMLVMLMEDAGVPFTGKEHKNRELRESFKTILKSIHEAGYIHYNLSLDSGRQCLLVKNDVATIVGFSNFRVSESEVNTDTSKAALTFRAMKQDEFRKTMDKELTYLEEILDGRCRDSQQKRRRLTILAGKT